MGYSTSLVTLQKMLPDLEVLASGRPCRWKVPVGTESQYRYKIREALYIAKLHRSSYPALARMTDAFTIKILGPGEVAALPNGVPIESFDLPPATTSHLQDTPALVDVSPTAHTPPAGNLPLVERPAPPVKGPQSAFTIITEWSKAKAQGCTKLHFPDAALDDGALLKVYKWARSHTPPLSILSFPPSVTVVVENEDVRDIQWTPENGVDHGN